MEGGAPAMEGGAPAMEGGAPAMEGVVTTILSLLTMLLACFEAGKYSTFPVHITMRCRCLYTSLQTRQKIICHAEKVDAKYKNALAKKLNSAFQKLPPFLKEYMKSDDTTLLQDLMSCFSQIGMVGRGDLKLQPKKKSTVGKGKTIECPITEDEFSPEDRRIVFRLTRRSSEVFCAKTHQDALQCLGQIFNNDKVANVSLSTIEEKTKKKKKYGRWNKFCLQVTMHNGLVFRSTTLKLWKLCIEQFGKLSPFGKEVQKIIENAVRREVAKDNSDTQKLLYCPCKLCKYASYGFLCNAPRVKKVKCPQGHEMCPKCGDNPHSGICAKIPGMDPATLELLMADSKECPTCSLLITRIDGCNHMRCSCGTHFCWRCEEVLDAHRPYAGHPGCEGLDAFGLPQGNNAGGGAYAEAEAEADGW
jgi:hypothetical protein